VSRLISTQRKLHQEYPLDMELLVERSTTPSGTIKPTSFPRVLKFHLSHLQLFSSDWLRHVHIPLRSTNFPEVRTSHQRIRHTLTVTTDFTHLSRCMPSLRSSSQPLRSPQPLPPRTSTSSTKMTSPALFTAPTPRAASL